MKNNFADKLVVCFGEILWDVLPSGKKPGGAPMNVAYHLHKLGIDGRVVSSIGNDQPGTELLNFLESIGLSADHIQCASQQKTSEVLAKIGDNHEVSYDIVYPVAWDYVIWKEEYKSLLEKSDAFIFGSLASRNSTSRETLFKMLDHAKYKVFDVNIRVPHYSEALITALLQRSDMVKMNSSELVLIAQWFDPNCVREVDCVALILERFEVKEILITKGGKGATYYTDAFSYEYPAYVVDIADTVGSGDSFLAAFLAMKLGENPIEETLDYAMAMGAFITAQPGACPPYSRFDLTRFIWKRKTGIT